MLELFGGSFCSPLMLQSTLNWLIIPPFVCASYTFPHSALQVTDLEILQIQFLQLT